MSRASAFVLSISSLPWAVTSLLVSGWWQSPAFGRALLPLWLCGLLWSCAAVIMVSLWFGRFMRPATVAFGLVAYAVPTFLMGMSIVWFTIEANAVSAMGSAIAWLTLGVHGGYLAFMVSSHTTPAPLNLDKDDHS